MRRFVITRPRLVALSDTLQHVMRLTIFGKLARVYKDARPDEMMPKFTPPLDLVALLPTIIQHIVCKYADATIAMAAERSHLC